MPDERPDPRDKTVAFRVPDQVYDDAQARAKKEKRSLSAILRAWLSLWSMDEAPSPPKIEVEDRRAQKRPRKRKPK